MEKREKGMNIRKTIIQSTLSVLILLGALTLALFPDDAIEIIATALSLMLFIISIRYLIYYFTMGRFMVGGRMILYLGMIILDLSIFSVTLLSKSDRFILLYLIGVNAFYGAVQLLHAFQGRGYGGREWRFKMINGVINLLISVCCIIFIRSGNIVVYIFAAGLVHTALVNILSMLRKEGSAAIQ